MTLLLTLLLTAAPWDSPTAGANLFNEVETAVQATPRLVDS